MREQNDPCKITDTPSGPGVPGKPQRRRKQKVPRNRPNIDERLSDDRTCIDPVETEPPVDKTSQRSSKPGDINDLT
jgi:hypothetical protein